MIKKVLTFQKPITPPSIGNIYLYNIPMNDIKTAICLDLDAKMSHFLDYLSRNVDK